MPNYNWPPMESRRLMGKRITRLDGIQKASGKAKYNSDVKPAGLLHAVILHSPHAHCRIKSIDTSEAEKLAGVTDRFRGGANRRDRARRGAQDQGRV
jgi:xanthine dehydrogenase YagR molybdenum-binding subunit